MGASAVASTVTVMVACSPGSTMPTVGDTVIQVAPEVAENEIGELLVVNVTVCGADGSGGAMKLSVAGVKLKVEGAAVTFSVTGIASGAAAPTTVSVTDDTYVPTARLSGLTVTLRVAGKVPLSRLTDNQKSVGGVAVVNPGLPTLAFIEIVCAFGSVVAPD